MHSHFSKQKGSILQYCNAHSHCFPFLDVCSMHACGMYVHVHMRVRVMGAVQLRELATMNEVNAKLIHVASLLSHIPCLHLLNYRARITDRPLCPLALTQVLVTRTEALILEQQALSYQAIPPTLQSVHPKHYLLSLLAAI